MQTPTTRTRRAMLPLTLLSSLLLTSAARAQNSPPITLSIDASEAPRALFHARMAFPVSPGPFTLVYPKWIPGEHAPTGPIINLVGLKLSAGGGGGGGKTIPWRRDDEDMFAFHCTIPDGISTLDASFDFLSPTDTNGFTASAATTSQLAMLSWNQVLLYPQGKTSDEVSIAAKLKLPAGWKFATALPIASESPDAITFKPVSLTTLVDSPVLSGMHLRTIKLNEGQIPAHELVIASDSDAATEMKPEQIAKYQNLVNEAGALFGARHYTGYHWLLTLSDHVSHFGLEHHESSDDRTDEDTLSTDAGQRDLAGLLAHEYVHSWNGKYRRPAGLATPDYQKPMKDELLWVYEGLTEYLGTILPPRAGFWTPEQFRENIAATAATMDHVTGRNWRPLLDTTVAAQLLYDAPREWGLYRRGVDFYPEGILIWLDVDVTLRRQSQGKVSLNDFCKAFHGGQSGPPTIKPYTRDEVIATLNTLAPYDWRTFFDTRINETSASAPLGGISNAGWKLVYTEEPNTDQKDAEERSKSTNLAYSLGLTVGEGGTIGDIVPGLPADKAGLSPGMKLIAVNGRKFTSDLLTAAVKASKTATAPLELLAENGDFLKTYPLDYHAGPRHPHLERDPAQPDLLSEIIKPLAPPPATAPK